MCLYRYQRILPDPLKEYSNLKLFIFIASVYVAEIYSRYLKFLCSLVWLNSTLVKQKILGLLHVRICTSNKGLEDDQRLHGCTDICIFYMYLYDIMVTIN